MQHYLASLASMACYGPGVTTKLKPFYLRVVGEPMVLERDPDSGVGIMVRQVLDTLLLQDGGGRRRTEREVEGSLLRSLSQAEIHSLSAKLPAG